MPKERVSSRLRTVIRMSELCLVCNERADRVDSFIAANSSISRSQAQALIADGRVLLNGKGCKKNTPVAEGDCVVVHSNEQRELVAVAQDIPLDIIYEDDSLLVINKPQGMVVHPAPGNEDGTLVNALLFHANRLSGANGDIRPGIVHRIDKMTSGLVVVAKDDYVHEGLAQQFSLHTARRSYVCLVHGNIKQDSGTVNEPIGRHRTDRKRMAVVKDGRAAVTHFEVIERFSVATLLRVELETGRTHQIRVHMAHIKHPILGDEVYGTVGAGYGLAGQALHGYRLQFVHPRTGQKQVFYAPLPQYFLNALHKLGSNRDLSFLFSSNQ